MYSHLYVYHSYPHRYDLENNLTQSEAYSTLKLIEIGFLDEQKRVRVFEKECPSINHIMVYDIRLSVTDENEDSVYASRPDLLYNLRRGHTIAEIYDPMNFSIK